MSLLPNKLFNFSTDLVSAPTALNNRVQAIGTYQTPLPCHPDYDDSFFDWHKWRLVYNGGRHYVNQYLQFFSNRETPRDFEKRKEVTPDGSFAAEAIDEIKNSIFQRLVDVSRKGGSDSYQSAVEGNKGGVDLKSGSLNWFIGHHILPELLVMTKVGVFVDSPIQSPTLANSRPKHPYFYTYKAEDILNWTDTSVFLRHWDYSYDEWSGLPINPIETFRHIRTTPQGVTVQVYSPVSTDKSLAFDVLDPILLNLSELPFVCFKITKSLMKSVANAQIALLNLDSSDISYALKGNYPFYTEQFDPRQANNSLMKSAQEAFQANNTDPTCDTPAPESRDEISVGAVQGRKYPAGTDRPEFINPSPEPLQVSMEKQKVLKDDIRQLVHLALSTVQSKAISADSKAIDQQGLEAGLSYIGLELEAGERQLARLWDEYESKDQIATVNYPKRWSLKTLSEVNDTIKQAQSLRDDIPSKTFKRQINKLIASTSLGSHISNDTLITINKEIEDAKAASSNPGTLATDLTMGLVGQKTAAELRDYPENEAEAAALDHAARLARIQASQTSPDTANVSSDNPAARGLSDLAVDPKIEASQEKIGTVKRGKGGTN